MRTIDISDKNSVGEIKRTRAGCRGIVIREGKLLLSYEKKTGFLTTPGGGLEEGESLCGCVCREVKEETGYEVKAGECFLLLSEPFDEILWQAYYFFCEITGESEQELTEDEAEKELVPIWLSPREYFDIVSRYDEAEHPAVSACMQRDYIAMLEIRRRSILSCTKNTRALGSLMTESDRFTRDFAFVRSDVPTELSDSDIAFLRDIGVTTAIDFRTESEVIKKPHSLCGAVGFRYFNFPIVSGSKVPDTPEAVPESYMEIAGDSAMADVFKTMAGADGGVIFNCNAGKDRSGTVTAILLMLAGVRDKLIIDDYLLTGENLRERLEAHLAKHPEKRRDVIFPNEKYMTEFFRLFREKYGDARKYLSEIGLTDDEIKNLYKRLVSD